MSQRVMVLPQSEPSERWSRPSTSPEASPYYSMAEERERHKYSILRELCIAVARESMYMERERRPAMSHESMHALEVRIHNLDGRLSLYSIAESTELMPWCMLTREG